MILTGPFAQINQSTSLATKRAKRKIIRPEDVFFASRAGNFNSVRISHLFSLILIQIVQDKVGDIFQLVQLTHQYHRDFG